jgi:hypothetical protein
MATPWKHPKTGVYWFRKRVPDDLREAVKATIFQRTLRTKDPEEAKSRFLALASEIDNEWRRLRRSARLAVVDQTPALTKKQIDGICGEFHRWFVLNSEDKPKQMPRWRQRLALIRDMTGPRARRPGLGYHFDAEVRTFLAEKQIVIDDADDYMRLSWALGKAGAMAMESLIARTETGDWSEHSDLKKFPQWSQVEPTLQATSRMLVVDVEWEQFRTDCTLSPATVKAWRPMLDKLTAFVGRRNVADIPRKQVVEWKDSLLVKGLKHKTVAEGYLAAARSFFNWALEREKVGPGEGEISRLPVAASRPPPQPRLSGGASGGRCAHGVRRAYQPPPPRARHHRPGVPHRRDVFGAKAGSVDRRHAGRRRG